MGWLLLLGLSVVAVGGLLPAVVAEQVGLTTGGGGYSFTLHAVYRVPEDAPVEPLPAPEQVYLIVEVSVQSTSAEPRTCAPSDFAIRDSQLTAYVPVALAGEGRLLDDGVLTPGDGCWGKLAFALPATGAPLRLEYAPPPLRDAGTPRTIQLAPRP
jgi:hypothetical protein